MTARRQPPLIADTVPTDRQLEMLAIMALGGLWTDRYRGRVLMRQRGGAEAVRAALRSRGCLGKHHPHLNRLTPAASALLKRYMRRIPLTHRQYVKEAVRQIDDDYATRQAEHDEATDRRLNQNKRLRAQAVEHRRRVIPPAIQRIADKHGIALVTSTSTETEIADVKDPEVLIAFFDDIQEFRP